VKDVFAKKFFGAGRDSDGGALASVLRKHSSEGRTPDAAERCAAGCTKLFDTVKTHGLGTDVLVGRITLSEAYERVRAKEQAASAKATDAIG